MSNRLPPLNFAEKWQAYVCQNICDRYTDANEISFWQYHVSGYEHGVVSDLNLSLETLKMIQSYTPQVDTRLNIGAGNGRLTKSCIIDALILEVIFHKLVANSADTLSHALITQYNALHLLSKTQGD